MKLSYGPRGTIVLEDVRILFRNFRGEGSLYNREGDRNFAILLDDPAIRETLEEGGWKITQLKPRNDEEVPNSILKVTVNIKTGRPAKVYLLTSRGRNALDEKTMSAADYAEIEGVDVTLRPFDWNINGISGRSAYLQTAFIKIVEDPLELKYAEDANQADARDEG